MAGLKEIAAEISSGFGTTGERSNAIAKTVFATITGLLEKGELVTIKGFGSFKTVTRRARVCRHPVTGLAINVPEKQKVVLLTK